MTPDLLARLREAQAAKRPVALLTRLSDGRQRLWPDDSVPAALSEAAEAALRDDKASAVALDGDKWFVHPHNPPARLIVVGAVHVAQALVPMAATLGFAVTVVDPRRAFATPERFPSVSLSFDWPDEAMAALAPDGRTAVVTLTHDPKLDDPALVGALRAGVRYVGAIGSKSTHAERLRRLERQDLAPEQLALIHSPIGLDLGARDPAEIALSVLAEIVAVKNHAGIAVLTVERQPQPLV